LMMNPVPWLQMTNMISYQGLVRTFPNQASSDAATNVALQMYMNDGTTAITPDTETGNILLQDGDQTLTFKVDYIATGKATSGNVNAVTNFHINYY
ncbi:hypothetical protein POX22_14005, partial [Escherichia coli]